MARFFCLLFFCSVLLLSCKFPTRPNSSADIPMALLIDSAFGISMSYPKGWVYEEKKSESMGSRQRNIFFTPINSNQTLRINLKVTEAKNLQNRSLADFKAEYLETILKPDPDYHLNDSAAATWAGENAFHAVYSFAMNGKPYLKIAEYITVHGNRDFSLTLEVANEHFEEQNQIFEKMRSDFRFDR
jgi:hypothetical protein